MIYALAGFVIGLYFLPIGNLFVDWFGDKVVRWWYNRPRR